MYDVIHITGQKDNTVRTKVLTAETIGEAIYYIGTLGEYDKFDYVQWPIKECVVDRYINKNVSCEEVVIPPDEDFPEGLNFKEYGDYMNPWDMYEIRLSGEDGEVKCP